MLPFCQSCEFRVGNICKKAKKPPVSVHLLSECPIGKFAESPNTSASLPEINLAAMTCYFNPANSVALRRNYIQFVNYMKSFSIPLYTFEMTFNSSPVLDNAFIIRKGTEDNILWQKEQMINVLAKTIPQKYNALAWLDADILFLDPYWHIKTAQALKNFPVCQLWSKWHFVNSQGQIEQTGLSVGERGYRYLQGKGHPGGAWAARREVFPLDITHILGGGDTVSTEAWLGMTNTFLQSQMNQTWKEHYKEWFKEAYDKVRGELTTLEGEAVHLPHGSRENRKYNDRSKWLSDLNYDPARHVTIENDLLKWTKETPHTLKQIVHNYFFHMRKEDEGCITSHQIG